MVLQAVDAAAVAAAIAKGRRSEQNLDRGCGQVDGSYAVGRDRAVMASVETPTNFSSVRGHMTSTEGYTVSIVGQALARKKEVSSDRATAE